MVDVNEPQKVFDILEEKEIPYIKTQIRIYYCKSCGRIFGLSTEMSQCDNCEDEITSVRVGDFMDSKHRWVVERKTTEDFANSTRDRSLHVQAKNMAMLFIGHKYVFLEGFISVMVEDPRNEPIKYWLKSMRSTLAQYGVTVWQMDDLDMLIYELTELDKKCDKMPKIYDVIDDKFKGWTDQKKIICKLLIISDKKADLLLEYFGTPWKIFEAIFSSTILYTRTGNPKGITGPIGEIKGFGPKFIAKNQELLLTSGKGKTE